MAANLADAHEYITQNAADPESWNDLDDADRQRFLNVAVRILTRKFSRLTIPDSAVYLYACDLSTTYNDVNKQAVNGVQNFSISGAASFSFFRAPDELGKRIPFIVLDEISAANGNAPIYRRAGMAVY